MLICGERPHTQGRVERSEVLKAIRKLKLGKAPGSDGIIEMMLKYGGEVVGDWMMWICNLAWEQSKVPEDWRKAIIVPIYSTPSCIRHNRAQGLSDMRGFRIQEGFFVGLFYGGYIH